MAAIHEFVAKTLACAAVATTTTHTEVDLRYYFVSPGKREMKAVLGGVYTGAASDSGTLDMTIQQSSTSVDSDFVAITGAAFTQLTDTNSGAVEEIHFFASKAYVRAVSTMAGTGTFDVVATLLAEKRNS